MRWFRPIGLVFMPVSVMGWLATVLAIAFCAQIFWFVDSRSHSVTDTLYGIFPFWVPRGASIAPDSRSQKPANSSSPVLTSWLPPAA